MSEKDIILLNFSLLSQNSFVKDIIRKQMNAIDEVDSFINEDVCFLHLKDNQNKVCFVEMKGNNVHLFSNFNGKFELDYNVLDDGGYRYTTSEIIIRESVGCFQEIAEINDEFIYDSENTLVSSKNVVNDYLRNINTGEFVKNLGLVNYTKSSLTRKIGNKLVMIENLSHFYDNKKDYEKYYVSDYEEGMLRSENGFKNVIPQFVEVVFDEYINVVNQNERQKIKSML